MMDYLNRIGWAEGSVRSILECIDCAQGRKGILHFLIMTGLDKRI